VLAFATLSLAERQRLEWAMVAKPEEGLALLREAYRRAGFERYA
jgi:hypothetical protein